MDKNGLLLEFPEVASMFMAQIFKAHSQDAAKWLKGWNHKLNEKQWTVVVVALWLGDQEELKKLALGELHRFPKEKSQKMREMLSKTGSKALDPLYAEISYPGQVNMLWAAFSATGDSRYIQRVVSLIGQFAKSPLASQKTIGEAALVSLAQNTMIHPVVEKYVKNAEKSHPDPTTRAIIQVMLKAIEEVNSGSSPLPRFRR